MAQVDLFPAPPRAPLPAPPRSALAKPAPPPSYVPDVEGARHREARIVEVLRGRPSTLEQILRRSHREGLLPLSQSATLADLRVLVDAGTLERRTLYAVPGPLTGRWMTEADLGTIATLLQELLPAAPPPFVERMGHLIADLTGSR